MTPRARELRIVYSPVEHAGPLPQVGRPADAAVLLRERLEAEPVEVCLVLLLNTKHHVIGVHELSRGTLDSCPVHPREVFKSAILANATGVIVAHYVPRHIMAVMCPESLCAGVSARVPTSAVRRSKEGT
jgi:DNA repair protein RadC